MTSRAPDGDPPMFIHVVAPKRIQPGDVLYEINERPLRGGPMPLREAREAAAGPHIRTRYAWELLPEKRSRSTRLVAVDARLKVGRVAPRRRVNSVVAVAAASIRKPKTRKPRPCREQLALFELPERRRP